MKPMLLLLILAAFTIAASRPQCASSVDPPLAPRGEAAMTPLVIGQSPLLIGGCIQLPVPFSGDWFVEVSADMNKGLANVALEDRFLIRTSGSFTKNGGAVADIDICIQKPVPAKEDEFRAGKSVEVLVVEPLSAAVKDALLAADDSATGGTDPVATVLMELLLTEDSGSEKVLDSITISEVVDPRGDS